MSNPLRRAAPALSCALLASLALVACGSSGHGDPTSSGASSKEDAAKEGLQFSRCMREHGVTNFPDPESSGGTVRLQFKAGANVNHQTMEAAQKACQKYQPAPKQLNLTPAEKVEHEEAVQKFAKCMREHGIELQAQSVNGGAGIQVRGHGGGGSGPNPESPDFKQAQETCGKLLPGGGPQGKPVGPSGSGPEASLSTGG